MTRVTRYAGIFETENRGQPVARYKGRMSPKTIERDFPHVVEIAVPPGGLGAQLDAMHYFHEARGIKACLGRGRYEDISTICTGTSLIRRLQRLLQPSSAVHTYARLPRMLS